LRAAGVALTPDAAVAPDLHVEPLGQRVHDADAHPVQTAGDLVRRLVELAAGVQHGHRQLDTGLLLDRVHVDGNAAAVVDHRDGIVRVDDDVDPGACAGERLVHRVVHDFVDEVVQAARPGGADVHARTLPYGFQTLEDLDLPGVVIFVLRH